MTAEAKSPGPGTGRTVVVVPIFNEEPHVCSLLERFRPVVETRTVEQVVFVDDGSTDRTAEVVRGSPHVQVVRHTSRRGCGAAIRSGFQVALRDGFDTVVVMAGNGKDNPAEIPRLLAPLQAGTGRLRARVAFPGRGCEWRIAAASSHGDAAVDVDVPALLVETIHGLHERISRVSNGFPS